MVSKQELSKWLAIYLDEYGYSEKRIQERIWMNDKNSLAKTISTQEITADKQIHKFLVGSRREGISLGGESDSDWMQMNKAVLCTDKIKNIKGDRHNREIFRIVTKDAPNGYTFLQCNGFGAFGHSSSKNLKHALTETPCGVYLSSSKYMDVNEDVFHKSPGIIGRNTVYKDRKGPSIPKQVKKFGLPKWVLKHFNVKVNEDIDFVRCIECHCPTLINTWLIRKRPYSWPSKEIMTKISDLPIHVVPVGLSGSKHEDLQWRFSFTLAEISLVQTLNETQRKMLIILRKIAKYQLQPVVKDISSYIIKNVTFWVVEKTDPNMFKIDYLLDRVLEAIDFLLDCIDRRVLKHFFVPGRNLFHGKLQRKQRKLLMDKLLYIKANSTKILGEVFLSTDLEVDFPYLDDELKNHGFLNDYDKLDTLGSYHRSTFQLARSFTYAYYCNYRFLIMLDEYIWMFRDFGTKWLSDPMGIDVTKKVCEPKRHWYRYKVITRNKRNNKRLLKLK